jgi:hypothetical protein
MNKKRELIVKQPRKRYTILRKVYQFLIYANQMYEEKKENMYFNEKVENYIKEKSYGKL